MKNEECSDAISGSDRIRKPIRYKREGSVLHIKSYAFAVRVVKMYQHLTTDRRLTDIYRQVLRSGTSISANVHESEFAQSSSDFVSNSLSH